MFPLLVWMYVALAHAEEREALRDFGKEYEHYAAVTPRWIPHWLGYDDPATHRRAWRIRLTLDYGPGFSLTPRTERVHKETTPWLNLVVMAIDYAWKCTACGTPNAAGTVSCRLCGCPAITSGLEAEPPRIPLRYSEPRRLGRAARPAVLW